ncbi:hypothetical protein GCM10027418_13660 [Mariniluteicoccus endophyticus]
MNQPRRAAIAGALCLVVAASGCGLFHDPPVDPQSPKVAQAREQATADLVRRIDDLGAGWAPAGEASISHRCEQGQHNWKIDDPWDNRCSVTVSKVFGVHSDYPGVVDSLSPKVDAQGWAPGGQWSLRDIKTNYYDRWYNSPKPPGAFPEGYPLSGMPGASYERDNHRERMEISVAGDGEPKPPEYAVGLLRDHRVAVRFFVDARYFEN